MPIIGSYREILLAKIADSYEDVRPRSKNEKLRKEKSTVYWKGSFPRCKQFRVKKQQKQNHGGLKTENHGDTKRTPITPGEMSS